MPAVTGARFGHYELLSRIGAGGMGEVFRARDLDLQRDVAIKFLPAQYATDVDRLARFSQEARAASALNHPNIVTIHEIGQAFGQPYIVMELVEGFTLHDMLGRGRIEPKQAVELAAQMAEGLAKAHGAGIVHRDLKPENVMVTRDGFAKILDFGLAKLRVDRSLAPAPTQASEDDDTHIGPATALGVILGTVGYMSPEQAAGRPAVPQSDQFSLGAIVYEMATGQRAFSRATSIQTLSAILESEPTPLQELTPTFPVSARWIVERCLAKRPENRYASSADLAHDLRDVRDHFGEATSGIRTSTIRQWVASPRVRRRGLVAGTVLLALFGLLAVPPVNDVARSAIGWYRLPADKRVAVLPMDCRGGNEDEKQACEGMLEFLIGKLGELDRFQKQGGIAVVPAMEIRQSAPLTADAVRTRFAATLVVAVTADRHGDRIDYVVSLIDTAAHRQLSARRGSVVAGQANLLDQVLDKIVELLDVLVSADAQAALRAGGTESAEAASLYAQALRATPYQTGQSRLERHDQQTSLEQAIELFNRAIELDPSYAYAHASLGEAYLRLYRLTRNTEHFRLAEAHCERALVLDELVGQAWQTLGNLHTEAGKADQALADFAKALAQRPRSPEVLPGPGGGLHAARAHRRRRGPVPQGDRPAPGFVVDLLLLRRVPLPAEPLRGCGRRLPAGALAGARQRTRAVQPRRPRLRAGPHRRNAEALFRQSLDVSATRVGRVESRHASLPARATTRARPRPTNGPSASASATTASGGTSARRGSGRQDSGPAPSRPIARPWRLPKRSARSTRTTGGSSSTSPIARRCSATSRGRSRSPRRRSRWRRRTAKCITRPPISTRRSAIARRRCAGSTSRCAPATSGRSSRRRPALRTSGPIRATSR